MRTHAFVNTYVCTYAQLTHLEQSVHTCAVTENMLGELSSSDGYLGTRARTRIRSRKRAVSQRHERLLAPHGLTDIHHDRILLEPCDLLILCAQKPIVGRDHHGNSVEPSAVDMLVASRLPKHDLVQPRLKDLLVRENHVSPLVTPAVLPG